MKKVTNKETLFTPDYGELYGKTHLSKDPMREHVTFKPKKAAKVFREYALKYGSKST